MKKQSKTKLLFVTTLAAVSVFMFAACGFGDGLRRGRYYAERVEMSGTFMGEDIGGSWNVGALPQQQAELMSEFAFLTDLVIRFDRFDRDEVYFIFAGQRGREEYSFRLRNNTFTLLDNDTDRPIPLSRITGVENTTWTKVGNSVVLQMSFDIDGGSYTINVIYS